MITVLKTMLVAGLALVAVEHAASSVDAQSTVRLADPTPVTLRGVGFVPYESLRLEVRLETSCVSASFEPDREVASARSSRH